MSVYPVILFVAALGISPAQVTTSRCEYTVRSRCAWGELCSQFRPKGEYLLIPPLAILEKAFPIPLQSAATIQRCDQKGCTAVEVWAHRSGAFLNVWQATGGYMMKFYVGPPNLYSEWKFGDFMEVATLGLGVLVSAGHCPVWRAP
jgi:hypothetical protein